ncbi:MAG: hypothetical protein HY427_02265 [Candidatus Levybacteria bacterium]|nr:hypothetical protein [Candidatus Levybacteria bacterium]
MRFFTQSTSLIIACALVLIIISTPLSSYMTPILGLVIAASVIFIVIRQRSRRDEELFVGSNKEVFTITLALLLSIFLTGGLSSNLFFLLYFLLFGIVFLFEPGTVFVLLLGLGAVFFQSLNEGDLISNLIKLGSLVFLSPISYFFGREFQRREKLSREVEDKTGQILEDAEVLREKTQNEDEIDEIEDIEQKAEDLRKEAQDDSLC